MQKYVFKGDSLLVDVSERIATITLNRPESHNALSQELRSNLAIAFEKVQADDEVEVVILTGAGDKSFCVGLDLKEFEHSPLTTDNFGPESPMMRALARLEKPLIGAINGFTVTGGFELACNCDFLVGSANAKFADTHVRVGVLPGWGISQNLPRLIGPARARFLCFTGNYLDAATAKEWGLLLDVVAAADLLSYCRKLASDMLSADQPTLRKYRELIQIGQRTTVREGLEEEARVGTEWIANIDIANFASTRSALMRRGKAQTEGK